jgi:hypothetical protein
MGLPWLISFGIIFGMTKSDAVRAYVLKNYVAPARRNHTIRVNVRAGDVAKALDLSNRLPLVCGALGAMKFQSECGISLLQRTGPGQGANAIFTFAV